MRASLVSLLTVSEAGEARSCWGEGGTCCPAGAWAPLLECLQKCLQVSWEPQSKALDQEEMCLGLGLNFDGQPGGVLAIAALTLTFLSCSTSAPSLCLLAQTSGAL